LEDVYCKEKYSLECHLTYSVRRFGDLLLAALRGFGVSLAAYAHNW
jgi:hypothetical protein